MIVQLNPKGMNTAELDDSWLKPRKRYHVIGITGNQSEKISYGVVIPHRTGRPDLISIEAKDVTVVSDIYPSNWKRWSHGENWGLSPEQLQSPEFLEGYHNGDKECLQILLNELATIEREDPIDE